MDAVAGKEKLTVSQMRKRYREAGKIFCRLTHPPQEQRTNKEKRVSHYSEILFILECPAYNEPADYFIHERGTRPNEPVPVPTLIRTMYIIP